MTNCIQCNEPLRPRVGTRISANRKFCNDACKNRHFAARVRAANGPSARLPASPLPDPPTEIHVPLAEPSPETLAAIDRLILGSSMVETVTGPLLSCMPDFIRVVELPNNQYELTVK